MVSSMGKRGRRQRVLPPEVTVDEGMSLADIGASLRRSDDAIGLLNSLAAVTEERRSLALLTDQIVSRGRELGLSWTQLGAALGVSSQAVAKKYGKPKKGG